MGGFFWVNTWNRHRKINFIVIGDRFVDIELAKRYNLFSIGCGYGYGNYNELKDADYIIDNFKDIISIIEI